MVTTEGVEVNSDMGVWRWQWNWVEEENSELGKESETMCVIM